jgi:glycosyltransferase involved in cell wall biosynthesis
MMARRLARKGVPVVAALHEFAFPFGDGGNRETIWAVTHRAALVPVWSATAGVIVTTEDRAHWLRSRRWLPHRPVSFVPVCSNLPVVSTPDRPESGPRVGVFGFAAGGSLVEETAAALSRLRDAGLDAQLVLIGAPGPAAPDADAWRRAAGSSGFGPLVFTGVLEPVDLARALCSVDVVLLADRAGPMSRKTTLAAALALGRPVVAADGPRRWDLLAKERAVVLARPSAEGLASALESLLREEPERRRQGVRGEAFYRRWMTPERFASEILVLLNAVGAGSHPSGEDLESSRPNQPVVT